MSIRHIVCVVDLSSASRPAALLARDLAARHGATLELDYAARRPLMISPMVGTFVFAPTSIAHSLEQRHRRSATRALAELAESLREGSTVPVEARALMHVTCDELLEHATDVDADLIVVGTDELGPLDKLLHRAAPETLARRADRPVLTLVSGGDVPGPIEHALVATDYTDDCRRAADLAAAMVGPRGRLTFLHVCTSGELYHAPDAPSRNADSRERVPPYTTELRRLREFVDALNLDSDRVASYLAVGDRAREIASRAEMMNADAIVVGSHPHRGWADRLIGTLTDRLIEHGGTPVLAVPEQGAA